MLWRRGTAAGALSSIAVSATAVVALLVTQGINSDAPIYGGLALSVAVYIIISLVSQPAVKITAKTN